MAMKDWDEHMMLDVYILDYFLKRKLHNSAKAFMTEAKVATDSVAIDAPGGFLFEWWSVFWDICITRINAKHSEPAAAYIETQLYKTREQQQQQQLQMQHQMQQLQHMQQRSGQLQRRDPNHPPLGPMNSEGMLKMYEESMKHPLSMDSEIPQGFMEANRLALLKSASSQQEHLMQRNPGGISAAMQQMQDIKGEGHFSAPQKSLSLDASSIYGQAILQSKSGLGGAGLNQGVGGLPLKGWPTTGIDQLGTSWGLQKPNLPTQNQFLLASQQQQALAQAQVQGNLGNSSNYGFGVPSFNFNAKDGQPFKKGVTIDLESPVQSNSQKKIKMTQMQQSSSQQQYQLQQPQQMQQDDLENFEDVGGLEDNVEAYLSNDGEDGNMYGSLKQTHAEHKTETSKGYSFEKVGCIRAKNKVTCCHFSSDGKLLASAGDDKEAVIWNMDTLQTDTTMKQHQNSITDVRFQPNSTQLATASFDKSVRIWDAAHPRYCVHAYTGHTSHVMSLDFHPEKNDLFCFSDGKNEINYWSMSPFSHTRISKQEGSGQVRFEPRTGQLLAAASDKVVSVFDVETDRPTQSFQGHSGVVNDICWDVNGDHLASVSEDCIKVWSVKSGKCIRELNSVGNKFYSCVFHPSHSAILIVGGLGSLDFLIVSENRRLTTITVHENIVAALAQSPVTGMTASASHDNTVTLWK
ncbi:hypothetical protein ABFS83_14G211300 [Erythranthe nasuta]